MNQRLELLHGDPEILHAYLKVPRRWRRAPRPTDQRLQLLHRDPEILHAYWKVPRRWRSAPRLTDQRLLLLHRDPEILHAAPEVGEMSQSDERASKGSNGLRNKHHVWSSGWDGVIRKARSAVQWL
jgi:hypothetical protein